MKTTKQVIYKICTPMFVRMLVIIGSILIPFHPLGQSKEIDSLAKQMTSYYKSKTRDLTKNTSQGFWEGIKENPAFVTALIAALVALFSLLVNNRTALRNQKDIQFYEALRRFGDKDSPTLRSSAAGLLKIMGLMERQISIKIATKAPFFKISSLAVF